VFFIDHRNDIVVNAFGLAMSIVGSRVVWYVDPIGAILIGLLILVSWAANAFEHVWLLVGKSAPKEFLAKLAYLVITHDNRIQKVDTVSLHVTPDLYPTAKTSPVPRLPRRAEILRRSRHRHG
jgi:divalent metal cation (Fe/Co/Zn/Cd) transporter